MSYLVPMPARERILGGLWGSLVGDALGVPVEFKARASVQSNPVKDMYGFGTHHQPPGTWSDDSSLLLCCADSLVAHEFDTGDMGNRFVCWHREELWTPHGKLFDIGIGTSQALARIASGIRAEDAGGADESSNGNGSLMRILPVALRFAESVTAQLLDRVHRVSAITHQHPRSQMACGLFALVARELLNGHDAATALAKALWGFQTFYETDPRWSAEWGHFEVLLAGDLAGASEDSIESGGYVMHTLKSASFEECVLKAVNLGGDTDTTGCVAGGLAGVHYGLNAIPSKWIDALARRGEIELLFNRFLNMREPST